MVRIGNTTDSAIPTRYPAVYDYLVYRGYLILETSLGTSIHDGKNGETIVAHVHDDESPIAIIDDWLMAQ